jgi:hypothetical protein
MFKTEQHTGPVRGLDFNATQSHVLATGATNGEVNLLASLLSIF